ncbi:MAG: hypothetical protein LBU32_07255 [Clostridiales bacterium]|jgi:hypothetical protein|nr:hypothetical protein [Clostridiales bacterium]
MSTWDAPVATDKNAVEAVADYAAGRISGDVSAYLDMAVGIEAGTGHPRILKDGILSMRFVTTIIKGYYAATRIRASTTLANGKG